MYAQLLSTADMTIYYDDNILPVIRRGGLERELSGRLDLKAEEETRQTPVARNMYTVTL
jgi:hypothetical protein